MRADYLDEDGRGLCLGDEVNTSVSDLLPGESAIVEIEHRSQHRRQAWARIAERTGPFSEARTTPVCAAYGQCGGCSWQHLRYDAQLEEKRGIVERAFAETHGDVQLPVVHAAPSAFQYRNQGKYVVGRDRRGKVVLGGYKPRSHELVSTLGCQIVEAVIDETAVGLREVIETAGLAIYDEKTRAGGLRYVLLRSNGAGDVMATLVCSSDMPTEALGGLCEQLLAQSRVTSVYRCDNDLHSGALLTPQLSHLGGATHLVERVFDVELLLGPSSFFQVHRRQAEQAYRAIADALDMAPGQRVLELYAGVGGIGLALAHLGLEVDGVERNAEAVKLANRAAERAGLSDRARFHCGDAAVVDEELGRAVAAIVVDPPRKGLGEVGCAQLLKVFPDTIVYLSCGPESLARDLAVLREGGYRIEKIELFDFMPGTSQVESLAVLRRR